MTNDVNTSLDFLSVLMQPFRLGYTSPVDPDNGVLSTEINYLCHACFG